MTDANRLTAALTVALVAVFVGAPAAGTLAGPVTAAHPGLAAAVDAGPGTDAPLAAGSPPAQEPVTTTTTDETTPNETTPDHEVSPRELPERPDSLNASNAPRYVAGYEEVRKHNEILRETTDVTITSVDVRCGPGSLDSQDGSLDPQDDGFVVEVACGFSYEFGRNGTPTGVADGLPYIAQYFVDGNTTELLGLRAALGVGEALSLSPPEKPDPLNESTVLSYAVAYEEVRKHNEILNEANSPNATVTETFVSCTPELVEETDGGFLVDVSCSFAYFVNQDGNVVMVESLLRPSYTASYRINETATELVTVRQASGPDRTTTPAGTTVGGEATTAGGETTAAVGGETTAAGDETPTTTEA